jgi:hypothetical protein
MSIDRLKLLQQRSNARRAMNDVDLPEETRALYRKAEMHAGIALALQDALKRKAERDAETPRP